MHCTQCGTALADGARYCGNCGTAAGGKSASASPHWSESRHWGCGAALAILAAVYVVGRCSPEGVPVASAGPVIATTAEDLWRAYDANEAAAEAQYAGSRLQVTGTVERVVLNMTNDTVAIFRTPGGEASVNFADQAAAAPAMAWRKGDRVTVTCEEVRELMGIPVLRRCRI